jgi:hypothetical protein
MKIDQKTSIRVVTCGHGIGQTSVHSSTRVKEQNKSQSPLILLNGTIEEKI